MSVPGNQNAAKGKVWRSVIAKRLAERAALELIADALIDKAIDGDMSAIKEIGDRTDGKSVQQVDLGGQNGENPLVTAINIRFVKSSEPSQDGD